MSAAVPHEGIPHAGGKYVGLVVAAYERLGYEVCLIAEDIPANRQAINLPGAPKRILLASAMRGSRLVEKLDGFRYKLDRFLPTFRYMIGVAKSAKIRQAVRAADVIDMQWASNMHHLPLVRLLNRRATTVATFHDVVSQVYDRQSIGDTGVNRIRYRINRFLNRRFESLIVRLVDCPVTLSEKDAQLLPLRNRVTVLYPPLYADDAPSDPTGPPAGDPVIMFLSYLKRAENDDAARWLISDIWPHVVDRYPQARLHLTGGGASDELAALADQIHNVELVGFVPDLDAAYRSATCCVVPLRHGAGIKFKTIEAVVAGVPTVVTRIGAEGVGGPELFAALSDDAETLSGGICEVLDNPEDAFANAYAAARRARNRFSVSEHERRLCQMLEGTKRRSRGTRVFAEDRSRRV